MRNILITTLLLGCFITFASSSQRGLFEFHDSYGRCWRCLPGSACVRCSTMLHPFVSGPPATWDRTCTKPGPDICDTNLGVKFPHVDIGFYWICAEEGIIVEAPCFCDQVFDMRAQECVKIEDLLTIACDVYANTEPHDCTTEGDRPDPSTLSPTDTTTTATTTASGNTPSIPTVSNEQTDSTTAIGTTISVPTVSNEPGTTTTELVTPPTDVPTPPTETPTPTEETTTQFTRTTEIGGPGASPHPTDDDGGNGDDDDTTTPPPCVCIVWWPCWCNPCWNMPCHSCNGCVGMMG